MIFSEVIILNSFGLISSLSRFPQAVTMAESVRRFHQEDDIYICIIDEKLKKSDFNLIENLNINIIYVTDLEINNFHQMIMQYTPVELCSSLKPFLINYLLNKGYTTSIIVDADMYLFNSLSQYKELLNHYSLILTPHIIDLDISTENLFGEFRLLETGMYNLGIIGISNAFDYSKLKWWMWHMKRFCFKDEKNGMFYDQRWMDILAPLIEGLYVLKEPSYNVAFWNLNERELKIEESKFLINDKPMTLFHFSAFSLEENMSQIAPWLDKKTQNNLDQLQKFYIQELKKNRIHQYLERDYGYAFLPGNVSLTNTFRKEYRNASRKEKEYIGNPFKDSTNLVKWWNEKFKA